MSPLAERRLVENFSCGAVVWESQNGRLLKGLTLARLLGPDLVNTDYVVVQSGNADECCRLPLYRIEPQRTAKLNKVFSRIPAYRFSEVDTAFGKWKSTGLALI
jgi:hypothetical protein